MRFLRRPSRPDQPAAPAPAGDLPPRRVLRRLVAVVVATVAVLLVALPLAGPAAADIKIPNPFGSPTDVCNNDDPPVPASPYGDGSLIVRIASSGSAAGALNQSGHQVAGEAGSGETGDPFDDPGVSLESTYGSTPQWWTYDNGCTGQVMAGVGAGLGNMLLMWSGIMPNWVQAMLDGVIDPSGWVGVMDEPVAAATEAIANGVWAPWLGVVLALVAVLVMFRAREGRLAGSITAAMWALSVLVVVSWLVQYPTESVRLVDSGVRTAVVNIATGFNEADDTPAEQTTNDRDAALAAVDQQVDTVVRNTQYRTWLAGVFGDADSATAEEYGPRLFRATHFSWEEYDTYQADPDGDGKEILESKQDEFKEIADDLKDDDPVAYGYFTGSHWGSRLSLGTTNLLVSAVVCLFLLLSALAILLSFALIRVLVPFAPAAGVIYMLEPTRDLALAGLKKVVGPLVMGPVFFVVGLLLLRFDAALLTSDMPLVIKLCLIGVVSWVAWKMVRPSAYAPGVGKLRSLARTALSYVAAKKGVQAGLPKGQEGEEPAPGPGPKPHPTPKPTMVYHPEMESRPSPRELPAPVSSTSQEEQTYEPSQGTRPSRWTRWRRRAADEPAVGDRDPRTRRRGWHADGEGAPEQPAYARPGTAAGPEDGTVVDAPAGGEGRPGADRLDQQPHDARGRGSRTSAAARANRTSPMAESQVTYDATGEPVFVVYTPQGNRSVPLDDAWWEE